MIDDNTVSRSWRPGRTVVGNVLAFVAVVLVSCQVHATRVLLFNIGQVAELPTTGTVPKVADWSDRLLPEPRPPRIRTVAERYLCLRLDAQFDRPQTVRLS
jgi:hypothetical protein